MEFQQELHLGGWKIEGGRDLLRPLSSFVHPEYLGPPAEVHARLRDGGYGDRREAFFQFLQLLAEFSHLALDADEHLILAVHPRTPAGAGRGALWARCFLRVETQPEAEAKPCHQESILGERMKNPVQVHVGSP